MEEIRKAPAIPKRPGLDKAAQNIQEAFLNNARKEKIFLTIYLMSGVKLSGRIKSFDKYSVILETNNQEQLIFKHAVSTVVTQTRATCGSSFCRRSRNRSSPSSDFVATSAAPSAWTGWEACPTTPPESPA